MVLVKFKARRELTIVQEVPLECEVPDYLSDPDVIENVLNQYVLSKGDSVDWQIINMSEPTMRTPRIIEGGEKLRLDGALGVPPDERHNPFLYEDRSLVEIYGHRPDDPEANADDDPSRG